MTKKKDDSGQAPVQTDEDRQAALDAAPGGAGTATGQAKAFLSGEEQERLDSLESRGSTAPIVGGDIKPDHEGGQPPIGAQAEHASFTTNGSLPAAMVPSPTGLVPVGVTGGTPEEQRARVEEHLKTARGRAATASHQKLSRRQVESMSAAELRAVASDRGYDLGDNAGNRITRKRFLEEQDKDEGLADSEESGSGEESGT